MSSFLAKVRDTFNKITGATTDPESSALINKCEECTSEYLLNTDWRLQSELCDIIKQGNVGSNGEKVLNCLAKRFAQQNPRVQMHCLTVCEACVQNCGPAFHEQLAVSGFFQRIKQAVLDSSNPRRDAQVYNKMLILTEDWARALPYTVFSETLQDALASGAHLPHRAAADKAPLYDPDEYERQRVAQAEQSSLRSRFMSGARSSRPNSTIERARRAAEYVTMAATPDRTATATAQRHPAAPVPPSSGEAPQEPAVQIDPAVLESMSPADRMAVLAAMGGTAAEQAPAAPPPAPQRDAESLPAFDVAGSREQLDKDIAAAAEHAQLLQELIAGGAVEDGEGLFRELQDRCEAMRAGVLKVIDHVKDEGLLAQALQVQEQLVSVVQPKADNAEAQQEPTAAADASAGQSEAAAAQDGAAPEAAAEAADTPAPPQDATEPASSKPDKDAKGVQDGDPPAAPAAAADAAAPATAAAEAAPAPAPASAADDAKAAGAVVPAADIDFLSATPGAGSPDDLIQIDPGSVPGLGAPVAGVSDPFAAKADDGGEDDPGKWAAP